MSIGSCLSLYLDSKARSFDGALGNLSSAF